MMKETESKLNDLAMSQCKLVAVKNSTLLAMHASNLKNACLSMGLGDNLAFRALEQGRIKIESRVLE
jgi:hypothetical protein